MTGRVMPAAGQARGFRQGLALALLLPLSSCASELPPGEAGSFAPEAFFAGTSVSKGEVTTFWFRTQAFTAQFSGTASDGRLQLDETFAFADGSPLQHWDLRRVSPVRYVGTVQTENEDGVLSEPVPVEGRLTANGAILDYHGFAPGGGDTLLHFRHEMTERPDGTVANHVTVSKFGIPVATSDVTFAKSREALAPY